MIVRWEAITTLNPPEAVVKSCNPSIIAFSNFVDGVNELYELLVYHSPTTSAAYDKLILRYINRLFPGREKQPDLRQSCAKAMAGSVSFSH